MTNTADQNTAEITHHWAHLAKPPYEFLGVTENKFQAIPGDPECPIQPGGTCDYCLQAIMYEYHFVGADGRKLKVGCDCAQKSCDVKIISAVQKVERAKAASQRAKKARSVAEQLAELRADERVRNWLNSQPHPNAWRAQQGDTLGDYYAFVFAGCGAAGTAKHLKALTAKLREAGVLASE